MALVTVTIATSDMGLATAVTPVVIDLASKQPYVTNGTNDIQRSISTATNSGGTLSIDLEPNGGLSDTASTYTFTIGANVYSGIVVPGSGPVTLLSLLPAVTIRTVAITFTSWDASDAPEQNLIATAYLSVDCTNLDGVTILAGQPIRSAPTDSLGDGTLNLERTDQLTPVTGSGEPYFRITLGSAIYYKNVHAAGTLVGLPTALPTTTNGGISADTTALAHDSSVPALVDDPTQSPATLHDDLANLAAARGVALRTITSSATVLASDDWIIADATGGAITLTLQAASARQRPLFVIRKNSGANNVTLARVGSDVLNGITSFVLTTQYQWSLLRADTPNAAYYVQTGTSGGGSGTVTAVTGTAPVTVTNPSTTPNVAVATMGASGLGHARGLVPDPGASAGAAKYLREDATWGVPPGTGSASDATPVAPGVVTIDQSPVSGDPAALTLQRADTEWGVPSLGGDGSISSMALPAASGSIAEAGRWVRSPSNPILTPTGTPEGFIIAEPSILVDGGFFKLFYGGQPGSNEYLSATFLATCPITADPLVPGNWSRYTPGTPVIAATSLERNAIKLPSGKLRLYHSNHLDLVVSESADGGHTWTLIGTAIATGTSGQAWWAQSAVWYEAGVWHILAEGGGLSGPWAIYHGTSATGIAFTLDGFGPLSSLSPGGTYGGVAVPAGKPKHNGLYHIYYHAAVSGNLPLDIYHATSPDLHSWTIVGAAPILTHTGSGVEANYIANPSVCEANGQSYLFYFAYNGGADQLCLARFPGPLTAVLTGTATPPRSAGSGIAIDDAGSISASAGNPTVKVDGSTIGAQPAIKFISGTNVTLSGVNNSGASQVEVTVASSGGGGGSGVGELLMQNGVTSPPVPLETEDGSDWLYSG